MTIENHRNRWFYESDGDQHRRTHYAWRYNKDFRGGIERKDFDNKSKAINFIKTNNDDAHQAEPD